MQNRQTVNPTRTRGSVLVFVLILTIVLSIVGFAVLRISDGASLHASLFENEQAAILTAEAAYERAVYWMSDNPDLLLDMDMSGTDGSFEFPHSRADYHVRFDGFVGYRPVFEVTANGYSGTFQRSIRVYVSQAVSGWEMGMCRVPKGTAVTNEVYFVEGEVIDMPIHINSYGSRNDSTPDIAISGDPLFLKEVTMEESRYSSENYDKYQNIMDVFDEGIRFDQPKSLITDETSINKKINWYRETILDQRPNLVFTPQKNNDVPEAQEAVQLEFVVAANGKGYLRITDDCTVRGYTSTSSDTWDYKVRPGSDASRFDRYPIYAYHYIPENAESSGKRVSFPIANIQISADYGAIESPPCGMIFVDGNVVIGSGSENNSNPQVSALNVVQGKVSVVATGNIWIANTLIVSDDDDAGNHYPRQDDGMPALDNPNGVGLFARGVIKVIDPGLAEAYASSGGWKWVKENGQWKKVYLSGGMPTISGMEYEPVANKVSGYDDGDYHRCLPDPMVVEAAITVGGGGWGAENVGYPGGRKTSGSQDDLIVRGTLTEVIRGVVGIIGANGYQKNYYFDERMLSGLVPGTVRLKGKFVAVPGGWSDFRVDTKQQD